ncbi:MAG TPA: hypothetical protein VLC47_05890 [Burkholderiales bacterium]|nr:hypothetical protein [Burkholderiales bacterium]
MTGYEPIGHLASLLILAIFCMRSMVALRIVAAGSNLVFIAYGAFAGVGTGLVLHTLLLPINAYVLMQGLEPRRERTS